MLTELQVYYTLTNPQKITPPALLSADTLWPYPFRCYRCQTHPVITQEGFVLLEQRYMWINPQTPHYNSELHTEECTYRAQRPSCQKKKREK